MSHLFTCLEHDFRTNCPDETQAHLMEHLDAK